MKIVFIAEVASIHAARWINQFAGLDWDIHVFQGSERTYGVCPELKCGKLHLPAPGPGSFGGKRSLPARVLSRFLRPVARGSSDAHSRQLAALIREVEPDVVHSLGLHVNGNNMCLAMLKARQLLGSRQRSKWIYSSWGTDLDMYARANAANDAAVRTVLGECDGYIAECERDRRLAHEMGFCGEFLGFFPAYGGIPLSVVESCRGTTAPRDRSTIFLKGRDHGGCEGADPVGRAMTAMKAFRSCEEELRDVRVAIAQASQIVVEEAATLNATTNLDLQVLQRLPYSNVLRVMGASRGFIALTVNDGLPSSLVEAMALGACPIHSDLEPIREWIRDGENGLLVPPEDVGAVAEAVKRVMRDKEFVEKAGRINAEIVRTRLSDEVVRPQVIQMYQDVRAKK